ncbi:MAG: hypothetical protein IVW57_00840 [Ktedonobacterales bacterium]|nr:hypothetical protein [Ktedonobacterales bacterium]
MRVVLLGDSLTEGHDGASYVRILQRRVAEDPLLRGPRLINAGVAGDTVINLARRIPRDVVPHHPAWVVIFVGVNDATTLLARRALPTPRVLATRRYFRARKGVRGVVTPARYADGLRIAVEAITARTSARVALCTPATLGEAVASRSWRLLDRYAEMARQVAGERGCALIDLHATFARALAARPRRGPLARLGTLRAHALSRAHEEELARARGLTFTYDGIHLTEAGAVLVAENIFHWLREASAMEASAMEADASPT